MHAFLDSPTFTWFILPLLIFLARICDMSLDTVRIIMIGQGQKLYATLVAFFEVCIWLLVARQVITHLPNIACFFAYAGGFAAGNYVGMLVDEKLAIGHELIRVITRVDATELAKALRASGYGVTTVKATGMQGEVGIVYIVANRRNQKQAVQIIQQYNPNAFVTIQSIHCVNRSLESPPDTGEERLTDNKDGLLKHKIDA